MASKTVAAEMTASVATRTSQWVSCLPAGVVVTSAPWCGDSELTKRRESNTDIAGTEPNRGDPLTSLELSACAERHGESGLPECKGSDIGWGSFVDPREPTKKRKRGSGRE